MKEICPVEFIVSMISDKWKISIIYVLISGCKRTSEIKKEMPNISQKVLTEKLKDLEAYKIVERMVGIGYPLKVEYKLTPVGHSLVDLLYDIEEWGNQYIANLEA